MLPWEKALQWQKTHSAEDFWKVLGWHLSCGYVWSTPTAFALAHTIHWDNEAKEIRHDEPHNAWFVELAACTDSANALRDLLRLATHPMPWVCWRRDNGFTVRAYTWEKLIKKARIQ